MPKEIVSYTTYLNETLTLLVDPGLLLVSQGRIRQVRRVRHDRRAKPNHRHAWHR
jgi:hypothetical protein